MSGALVLTIVMLGLTLQARPAEAMDPTRSHIEAAAARFGLPAELIVEVIRVESNGRVDAVSRAGAMGLMQLMPATWKALRVRLNLGADPFDPHDNVMAGAAYLRQLRDRYGSPGFLAAYNAGPGRYEQSLSGSPLPSETRRYVERLSGAGIATAEPTWREAGLFATPWSEALGTGAVSQFSQDRATPSLFVPRQATAP